MSGSSDYGGDIHGDNFGKGKRAMGKRVKNERETGRLRRKTTGPLESKDRKNGMSTDTKAGQKTQMV